MKKLSAKLGDSMSTTFGCNDEKTNQVKKCYRKNAMIYHSDKHVNSTQEVKDTAGDNFKLLGHFNDGCEEKQTPSTCLYNYGNKYEPPSDGPGGHSMQPRDTQQQPSSKLSSFITLKNLGISICFLYLIYL